VEIQKILIIAVVLLASFAIFWGIYGIRGDTEKITEIGSLGNISDPNEEIILISGLPFYTSYDKAVKIAGESRKPTLVYFRSESCVWCMKFDSDVLSDKKVKSALEENFILASIDVNDRENIPIIIKFGVRGTPTLVFVDPEGKIIKKIVGFIDAKDFLKTLTSIT